MATSSRNDDDADTEQLRKLSRTLRFAEPGHILTKLKCCYCGQVCLDVHESRCKHIFCTDCLNNLISEGGRCPLDSQTVVKDDVIKIFKMEEQIKKLKAFCPNQTYGCEEVIPLSEISKHIPECKSAGLKCPQGCSTPVTSNALQNHLRFTCDFRHVPCQFCDKTFVLAHQQNHVRECPRYPVECPNQCGENMPQEEVEKHLRNCSQKVYPCRYYHLGCEYEGRGAALQSHEKDVVKHFRIMADGYSYLNVQFDVLMQETKGNVLLLQNDNLALRASMKEILRRCEQLKNSTDTLTTKLSKLQGYVNKILKSNSADKNEEINGSLESTLSTTADQCEEVNGATTNCVDSHLSNEMEKLREELWNKISEQDRALHSLSLNSKCDGVFIWKITEYHKQKEESLARRPAFRYSDPFYTGPHGYKMCAKVFLGGDAEVSGTHISVYVIIMRGPWDDILTWPFSRKLTISLLDQRNVSCKSNVAHTVYPNNSSSFVKPTLAFNRGAGVTKFASYARIENGDTYLKNDTIYIKIAVSESSKSRKKRSEQ